MRSTFIRLLLLCLLGCVAALPAAAQSDVAAELGAVNQRWVQAVASGSGEEVAALYAPGAQLLPPNGEMIGGHEAIADYWQGFIDSGFTDVSLTTLEAESFGDTAWEVGEYDAASPDGSDSGKYVVIWKKINGKWMLYRDIWNSSLPVGMESTEPTD